MKAVIYCRVAHDDIASLEVQKTWLTAYAQEHGFQITRIIAEHSSGFDYARKGLKEVSEAVANGKANLLLMCNLMRLGRDTVKTAEYLRWLKAQNVKVMCADGTFPQDHTEYEAE